MQILRKVLALGPLLKEVVVVDDGSQDRTADLVRELAAYEPLIRFYGLPVNRGKTAAIQRGLEAATGDIIIVQDADLEYDPAEIPDVIAPILMGTPTSCTAAVFSFGEPRASSTSTIIWPTPR